MSRAAPALAFLFSSLPLFAIAGPELAPAPGGLGFFGPTDPEVTAIWWNPAALGELDGSHLHLSGSPVFLSEQMARDGMAAINNSDLDPDLFAGAATDFGTEHFRAGFAYHVPFRDRGAINPGQQTLDLSDDGPLRYQRLHTDWRNHYFSPAAAWRVNGSVSFGAGLNVVWSKANLSFDRDTALDGGSAGVAAAGGIEQPGAAERVDVNGSVLSVGVSVGFLWRILGRVTIGGAFLSRPGALSRSDVPADRYGSGELNAHVNRPGQPTVDGYGLITFALPDVVNFGARWLVTDRLEAAATFRYVDWGQRSSALKVRLSSEAFRSAGVPGEILLYRGFADSYRVAVRGAFCAKKPRWVGDHCRVRLGLSAAFDTGQYDRQAVHADALDGPTLELGALFEWRLGSHLRFFGGGTYGAMLTQRVTSSLYDPQAALRCVDAGHDVNACDAADAGRGLPTTNGSYGLQSYTASLGLAVDFWAR